MRKKIVAGNWKMNMTSEEGRKLVKSIIIDVKERFYSGLPDNYNVVIAPPFTFLEECATMVANIKGMYAAAQNCHSAENGAYTGEISAKMIKAAGASYVI
ncbi:MAG TPA: triose-phosphate isomerase, partial [Bacteroidales bacterium]|nr:triose-phosphate isomerase [Bacteroidales bacterium]